jgi:transposase-like protein
VIELARSGVRVAQLAVTFGMAEATIYNWLRQERIDRGEQEGLSTDQVLVAACSPSARARSLALVVRFRVRAVDPTRRRR